MRCKAFLSGVSKGGMIKLHYNESREKSPVRRDIQLYIAAVLLQYTGGCIIMPSALYFIMSILIRRLSRSQATEDTTAVQAE